MRRLIATALLVLAVAAPLALAQEEPAYQTSSYTLTEKRPGASTGQALSIDYVNPDHPGAKPAAVRRVTLILPKGGRFDTDVPGQCRASDAELTAMGGAACPPDSKLGEGTTTVDSGIDGPGRFVDADIEFFNVDDGLIYVNTVQGSGARTIIRAAVSGRKIVTDVPMLPGTPPDGGAIDVAETFDPPFSNERGNYITTPPRCPKDRTWTARVRFEYGNGVAQTVGTENPCVKPKRTRTR